jgi:hypothetical protein
MTVPCNVPNMLTWIEALESGNYKQATGVLHKRIRNKDGSYTDSFCCGGVGCVVAGIPSTSHYVSSFEPSVQNVVYGADQKSGEFPEEFLEWLGVKPTERDENNFLIDAEDVRLSRQTTAIQANDRRGWNFEKIAKALRKRYIPEDYVPE